MTNRSIRSALAPLALGAVLLAGMAKPASAATLCVNSRGAMGCYATIGAAVAKASANDTIIVAPGTYNEDVIITQALTLKGVNQENTIINATGLANGIYIDGLDNPGLHDVVVTGFTVENANFEGILVTSASSVTLSSNKAIYNDVSLNAAAAECPGLPAFETNEGDDCGEGVHLMGVDHSIVANNVVEHNSGGILLSDETAATHDNLISGNVVKNNPYDCGITLASHAPAGGAAGAPSYGVYHNTITGNESAENGLAVEGAGAGVGIFDPGPGTKNYGNVVTYNRLIGNGLPGVAFHSHAPFQVLQDHLVAGNYISGNHKDTEDAATSGPTGINVFVLNTPPPGGGTGTGIVITQNVIENEAIDVAVSTPAGVEVQVHLNNFGPNSIGIDNIGLGTVNATQNWWGCPLGPGAGGCASVTGSGVLDNSWLAFPFLSAL